MGDLSVHHAVKTLLTEAVNQKIGSGMAASFGNLNQADALTEARDIYVGFTAHDFYRETSSQFPFPSAVGPNTAFDLASLTKVLATTTLAMKRHEQGTLDLQENLSARLPKVAATRPEFSAISIFQLLAHTSGLPAWKPFFEEMRLRFGLNLPWTNLRLRKETFDQLLYSVTLDCAPGAQVIYSDLGFLFLADILSSDFRRDVESLWRAMRIPTLHFRSVLSDARTARHFTRKFGESIAATEMCPWRGLLVGQVHDDNAWSLGGVAGHAGAFGTLGDVKAWIKSIFLDQFIHARTLRLFTRESVRLPGGRRALGFDLPPVDGRGSTRGSFSHASVGHLGFTGTSFWIDLQSGDYAVLLTNRVHPSRNDLRIRPLRQRFHELIRAR